MILARFLIILLACFSAELMAQKKETLRFCQGNMPPYVFKNQLTLQTEGIWPTVLEKIFSKQKNVEIQSFVLPWKRCQIEVLKGSYDGVFMFTATESRKRDYILLPSIHNLLIPYYYSTKKYPNGLEWHQYKDLKNKTMALIRGYEYRDDFMQAWKKGDIEAQYGPDIETNLLKLAKGRVDLAWDSERVVKYYLRKLNLANEIKQSTGNHYVHNAEQHFALSKKGKATKYQDFISKALIKMRDSGELADIINQDYSQAIVD